MSMGARLEGPWRSRLLIGSLGALSLLGYGIGFPWVATWGPRAHAPYVLLFAALFVLYLLAVRVVLRRPAADRVVLGLILGFGLTFRLALLPSPVILSSDVYRYLWDGQVQWAGVNPYRYPPAAEELVPLRDLVIHPQINRPAKRTVYPPGAEAVFAAVAGVAPRSLLAWRLVLLGCEAVTVGLLLALSRRMAVAPSAVLLYAWAPLAVLEGVQAGHLEFVLLPVILLALGWRQAGWPVRAGMALGAGILLKLYPVVLIVAWWRRGEWRLPVASAAVVAVGYLPYVWGVGPDIVGFLPEYFGSAEDFNVGLRYFLTGWIPFGSDLARETVRGVTMLLLGGALVAVLGGIARRRREDAAGVLEAAMATAAAYLVLVPTAMHAWYVAWILPFLVVRPSAAWLWFTGAVSLSYLKYASGSGELPLWARALEYLPLYALLLWERWGSGAAPGARAFPWRWPSRCRPGVAPHPS